MGNKQHSISENESNVISHTKSSSVSPKKKHSEDEMKDNFELKKSKSEKKYDDIFSSQKPFETYESKFLDNLFSLQDTNIFGYYLNTDPEEREYFISCPVCKFFNLDEGFNKNIT